MSRLPKFGSGIPGPTAVLSNGPSFGHQRHNSSSRSEISDSTPTSPIMSTAGGFGAPRGLRKPGMNGVGGSGIGSPIKSGQHSRGPSSSGGTGQSMTTGMRRVPSNASSTGTGLMRPPANGAGTGDNFQVNSRVRVESMNIEGTLRFLGSTHFKPGTWAGIELDDEGAGKNDGSVAGHVYFSCPPQTGIFVLASKLSAPSNANNTGSASRIGLRGPPGGLRRPSTGSVGVPAPVKPLNFRPESRASRFVGMSAQQFKRRSLMMTDDDDGYQPGSPQAANSPARSRIGGGNGLGIRNGLDGMIDDSNPADEDLSALNGTGIDGEAINGTGKSGVDLAEAQKIQARAEVLEAENRLLRLEVQQGKARLAAGELLERGIVGEAHAMLGRDEEVASLREKVERLSREKSEVEQERERLRREMTDRKRQSTTSTLAHVEDGEQLLRLTEALAERESRIRELEQTITELTKRVEAAEAAAKNLGPEEGAESIEALRQRIHDLEEAMHETDHALAQKEDEERELREQLERLMRERDFDDARRSHEGGDTERQQEQIRILERQLEEKSGEMGQLSARLDRISTEHEKEKATLEETIKQLRSAGQETIELYESKLQALQQAGKDAMALMDDEGMVEREALNEQLTLAQDEIQELRMAGAETIEVYELRVTQLKEELAKVQASGGSGSEADAALRLQLDAAREEVRAVQEAAARHETEMDARLREAQANGFSADSQAKIAQLEAELEATLAERLRWPNKSTKTDLEQRIVEADQATEQVRANVRQSISSMDDIMRGRDDELKELQDSKDALEIEIKQLRQSLEAARHESTDDGEVVALREELEDLRMRLKDANNAKAVAAQGTAEDGDENQMEELQRRITELTQDNREAKQENQRLLEVQASLSEAHRQVESECLKLMNELMYLHNEQLNITPAQSAPEVDAGIKLEEVADDDTDNPMPPEQRRLFDLLKEKQSQLEAQQRAHQQEQRQLQQRIADMEREHRAEVERRDKDINDLESLVESKIFREADLEEQLEQQTATINQLQQRVGSGSTFGNELTVDAHSHGMASRASSVGRPGARSPSTASNTSRSRNRSVARDYSQPYCDICEEDGHDIMSCPAITGTASTTTTNTKAAMATDNKNTIPEEDDEQFDRPYCDNCEVFGQHWTEDCPVESETF
ncbi:hypothetical protein BDF19DRAFT_421587 [Syncephalis fuscata]|nr:hypothetical protein BDF19DRAFT_421587 [Syncephalis fuscata]